MVEATKAGHLTPLEHSIAAALTAHTDSTMREAFRTSSEYLAAEAKVAAVRNFRTCQASLTSFMDMDSDNIDIDEIQSAVSAVRSAAESAGVPSETAIVRSAYKRLGRLSSSKAGAFAASTSGGGGSVDGDERQALDVRQSPGGGGDGCGNPLNSLTGGRVDFDEHSNGPKTDDVATGAHGLLPDEGDSQLTGSVALGGSSSMVMVDIASRTSLGHKINASSESTTLTTTGFGVARHVEMTYPREAAPDGCLDEGGRKVATMSDVGSSTGTVDGSGGGGGSFNNQAGAMGAWNV